MHEKFAFFSFSFFSCLICFILKNKIHYKIEHEKLYDSQVIAYLNIGFFVFKNWQNCRAINFEFRKNNIFCQKSQIKASKFDIFSKQDI
jgi:hypothetical protein